MVSNGRPRNTLEIRRSRWYHNDKRYISTVRFEIQAVCPATGARAGLIHTAHGTIETPVFMPVGTQATVKGVLQRDLEGELDAQIILGNTYHLFLRPGHDLIRQFGGLQCFLRSPR